MGARIGRRQFLATAMTAAGASALGPGFLQAALAASTETDSGPYGPLGPPNDLGMALPKDFTGREIARGGKVLEGYPWHFATDGQATYRTSDGGFVLVANSEAPSAVGGGASAIRFTEDGRIERAYRILGGTNLNCAGGPTPWGTWLSCEEHHGGMVWEADPAGRLAAQPRPALGNFAHEAAAVDPVHRHVYLTEDEADGCFYRFTPDSYPSLLSGVLEVAAVAPDGTVTWLRLPDPNIVMGRAPTRRQVAAATRFNGGEGLWYDGGTVYFTTKGDRRVWAYDTEAGRLDVIYDRAQSPDASLDAVDNVTVSATGDVYVCEDGGNMEIGVIADGTVSPFVRMEGADHERSEMAGVVFDPSGTRMYFASQRAYPYVNGTPLADGAIYEVTGPFRLPPGGVPADKVYGPPAGETAFELPGADVVPGLAIDAGPLPAGTGVRARITVAEPSRVVAAVRTTELETRVSPRWLEPRPVLTTLASVTRDLDAGTHEVLVPFASPGPDVPATLTVVASSRNRTRSAVRPLRS